MPAPKSVASWVLCRGLGKTLDEMTVTIPHDLYAFGTQENSVCDREWVESLRAMLKEQTELDYKPVRNASVKEVTGFGKCPLTFITLIQPLC